MYEGINKSLGPFQSNIVPFKSTSGKVITDGEKQIERWVEHYLELYSRETSVTNSPLDAIEPLSIMEELDAEPILEDFNKAIDTMSGSKATRNDSIPPDLVKHINITLLQLLHDTLCHCWCECGVKDAKM